METDPKKFPHGSVELPTPTAWPIVAAFGLALAFFGLVTHPIVSFVGVILGLTGAIGWCLDIFPHPKHEAVPIVPAEEPVATSAGGRVVQMLEVGNVPHRARIPIEVHPYMTGLLGGLAGAAVMAFLACLWGVFKYGSIWYPINLLAAAGVPELAEANVQTLRAFSMSGLVVGSIAHLSLSILIGLLYVVMVPMLPRRVEWLFGGILPPLLWSALIFASLRLINPTLAAGIDWLPFLICQVAFGAVCGFVVFKSGKVETIQNLPLAVKLGVEAQHKEDGE
jgi:uncharacterized membrane protein YagU involved in acid resistance